MTRCGLAALGRIKQAFVIKARGGTDEAGDRWAPLAPMTIALRRRKNRGVGPIEILRDTGLLLNSLSPGIASPQQVFRVGAGMVTIGTNREGAADHHTGNPKRHLPQRRLWPEPGKWPLTWWQDILEQARAGVLDLAVQMIRE